MKLLLRIYRILRMRFLKDEEIIKRIVEVMPTENQGPNAFLILCNNRYYLATVHGKELVRLPRKHYYSSFFLMVGSFIKRLFKPRLKTKWIVSDVSAKELSKSEVKHVLQWKFFGHTIPSTPVDPKMESTLRTAAVYAQSQNIEPIPVYISHGPEGIFITPLTPGLRIMEVK